jgi:3-methyl-2-oxobutanoate hydroxymethyltransferase
VLEGIPAELAREITEHASIPTIGIDAGVECDGQVL